jgi:hypothetical protein
MQTLTALGLPAAYLNLCRSEPFDRDFEPGDWVVYKDSDDRSPAAGLFQEAPAGAYPEAYAWVPRLDQLLEKLGHEELAYDIGFDWWPERSSDKVPQEHWRCYRTFMEAEGRGSCREEAAYRLLLTLRARL